MTVPLPCPRQAKPLDAGVLQPEISSFALYLAAEGKSPKTIRTYTEAAAWFAAASPARAGRPDVVGAGRAAGCAGVDGAPAGPVQPGLCQ
jgi:hypothetical protein